MLQLQPVKPVTVFQAVFEQLSALLASEGLVPGDRLPPERELAEQLRVSRPAVREALKALQAVGLIEVRGRSTYIKASARAATGSPLSLALPEAELLELLEFREGFEPQIAALAAERADDEDIAALECQLANMRRELGHDEDAFFRADHEFHRALGRAARNRLLLAVQTQVYEHDMLQPDLYEAGMNSGKVSGALARTVEAHGRILAAVRTRDGQKARRLMQAHLAQAQQHVVVGAAGQNPTASREASSR